MKTFITSLFKRLWYFISNLWVFHPRKLKRLKDELKLLRWNQAIGVYNTMKKLRIEDPQQALKTWIRIIHEEGEEQRRYYG